MNINCYSFQHNDIETFWYFLNVPSASHRHCFIMQTQHFHISAKPLYSLFLSIQHIDIISCFHFNSVIFSFQHLSIFFSGAGGHFSGEESHFSGAGGHFSRAGGNFSGAGGHFSGAGSHFSGAGGHFSGACGHFSGAGGHFSAEKQKEDDAGDIDIIFLLC